MNAADALVTIKGYAAANRIRFGTHSLQRMAERGAVRVVDVRSALISATTCKAQDNGRWRVEGGVDLDGDDLTVVCVIESGVVVVTLFQAGRERERP